MDLGLDGVVKMIDERFGRRFSTLVLLALSVGIIAWAVRTLFDVLAPTASWIGDRIATGIEFADLLARGGITLLAFAAVLLLVGLASVLIEVFVLRRAWPRVALAYVLGLRLQQDLDQQLSDNRELLREAGQELDESKTTQAKTTEILRQAQTLVESLRERNEDRGGDSA